MKTLTLTLDDDLYAALQEQAEMAGRSVDELAAEAIAIWLFEVLVDDAELEVTEDADLFGEEDDGVGDEEFFQSLRDIWLEDRPKDADVLDLIKHPAYQVIIDMGQDAVPFILRELEKRPDYWFWALYSITGADPITDDAAGNLQKMTDAWLNWARENGYNWQSDSD